MSASEETAGPNAGPPDDQPVSTLRGAGVEIDTARITFVVTVLALVVVMVVAGVLLIAGIRKNSQIDTLKAHGVPVELTVTLCRALTGGTGSSPAGYECTGTYVHQGIRYFEGVPGSENLPVGSTVHGIIASGDPALFSTPGTVAKERVSLGRVALPAIALAAAAGVCVWVVVRHRRRASAA